MTSVPSAFNHVFHTFYLWEVAIVGVSGLTIIGWKFLQAQWAEGDDDSGMGSKKHIKGVIRVIFWTIGFELATVIFNVFVPKG